MEQAGVRALDQKKGFDGEAPGALTLEQDIITHRGRVKFEFSNAYELEFCGKSPS